MKSNFQEHKYFPKALEQIPQISGVYGFYDKSEKLLYIGKAKDLRKRISSYFMHLPLDMKTKQLVSFIDHIRIITVQSEFEALLLEARLIRTNLPKYNVIWRDDKHYIYIKITREEFPRILFARKEEDKTSIYFGPFPSSWIIREILRYIRTIIPYCTQNRRIKRKCFYSHLGLCDPCPGEIAQNSQDFAFQKKLYQKNISQIKLILGGQYKIVERNLKKTMALLSKEKRYEEAAKLRDNLFRLKTLLTDYHLPEAYLQDPYFAGKTSLKENLELKNLLFKEGLVIKKLKTIECYDISNINGKFASGSMVVFVNGQPAKSFYRKFRIKLKNTPNDFAMLSEVLSRRLKHDNWDLPDLFVIDGGKPQLMTFAKVIRQYNLKIPFIGIAKEFEELVLPLGTEFKKIKLPHSSNSLHLIQRIRDEAHRFAHDYHEKLRLAYLLKPL